MKVTLDLGFVDFPLSELTVVSPGDYEDDDVDGDDVDFDG